MKSGKQYFNYDDDMIAAELKTKPFKHAAGKRLVFTSMMSKNIEFLTNTSLFNTTNTTRVIYIQ